METFGEERKGGKLRLTEAMERDAIRGGFVLSATFESFVLALTTLIVRRR